jgi:hypothetical protein
MSIGTLFRYLIGNRDAILTKAADRRYLGVGFLFVLSAALAREYDGKDLLHEPWHLFIPVGASLAASLLLSLLVLSLTFRHLSGVWGFMRLYLSMLGLFWMTAPLAWIYAIPFERFMTPVEAMRANLWCLALVSVWRVLLMMRVIQVLTGCGWFTAVAVVMFFADVVAFVAGALIPMPIPLFLYMGGVRITPEMAFVRHVKADLLFWGGCSLPVWIIGYVVAVARAKGNLPVASSNLSVPTSKIAGLWILAFGSLAIWLPILPFTQREQLLKTQVENALEEGRIADALAIMSAHRQEDFPPHWEPPPRLNFSSNAFRYEPYEDPAEVFSLAVLDESEIPEIGSDFNLQIDVWEALADSSEESWYRRIYVKRLDDALGDPALWFTRDTTRLTRMVAILRRLEEGAELARKHHDFLARGLTRIRNAREHKKLIQAILDLGPEHEEPRTK